MELMFKCENVETCDWLGYLEPNDQLKCPICGGDVTCTDEPPGLDDFLNAPVAQWIRVRPF